MSLTYDTYSQQIANLAVISTGDANLATQMPGIIDNGEQQIYRDLDFLVTRVTTTQNMSSGSRVFSLSTASGNYLVVEEVNVITPITATSTSGTRVPLTFVDQAFIDLCYPSDTAYTTVPEFWAMRDNANIIVGPSPDASYLVETVGTQRPEPLSSGNSSTFLTQVLPDLFVAASMKYVSAYLKNFGAQSDDPRSGMSWSQLYDTYLQSATVE